MPKKNIETESLNETNTQRTSSYLGQFLTYLEELLKPPNSHILSF